MNYQIGKTETVSNQGPARVKSVLVTSGAGGAGTLSIYPYNNPDAIWSLDVTAPAGSTVQVSFSGMPFMTGFTADPGTNVTHFVIEYEYGG